MAIVVGHGGNCCGMKHIHSFHETPEGNVRELIRTTTNATNGDGWYQLEVILSAQQTRDNPGLVKELARLGYVYTSSWVGQHGTPVHLFLRAKHRLALRAANFYRRWAGEYAGMLPHPDLAGQLPALAEAPNRAARRAGVGLEVGDRVRNVLAGGARSGQFAVVTRRYDGFDYQIRYEEDGHFSTFVNLVSVEKVQDAAVDPEPVHVPPTYRHPNADNLVFVANPAPARTLILSQFYCVFRSTGQASRVFATLVEAQAAYPLALDWHERKVYSNGDIVEGPVQHG